MKNTIKKIFRNTSLHIFSILLLLSGIILYGYSVPSSVPGGETQGGIYNQLFSKIYKSCPEDQGLLGFDNSKNNICVDLYKYQWKLSNWSSCSTSCGLGTNTRTVSCESTQATGIKSRTDNYCTSRPYTGTKPSNTKNCNNGPCYTYSWYTSAWSACSQACYGGGGTQSRTVYCRRNDGASVSDGYCAGGRPVNNQSCGTKYCYRVYAGRTGHNTIYTPTCTSQFATNWTQCTSDGIICSVAFDTDNSRPYYKCQ